MTEIGCPVCGYPEYVELNPDGAATYDICPCCGFESGVDGIGRDRQERNTALRQRWIQTNSANWWSQERPPPGDWNAADQLRVASMLDHDAGEDESDD